MVMGFVVPSCVVVDGRLTGFQRMPSDPFVWVYFGNNSFDEPKLLGRVDRVLSSPELLLDEDVVDSLVAVSDEWLQLLDKYGVPFTEVSLGPVVYEPGLFVRENALPYHNCQLFVGADGFNLWQCFVRLLDVWVETYVRPVDALPAEVDEVLLMGRLLTQFQEVSGSSTFAHLTWDAALETALAHVFMEPERRVELQDRVFAAREQLLTKFGYHHVW